MPTRTSGQADLPAARHQAKVAGQRQLAAPAHRRPVDRRDHRLRQRLQLQQQLVRPVQLARARRRAARTLHAVGQRRQFPHVIVSDEDAVHAAGQDEDARLRVVLQLPGQRRQLRHHRGVHQVARRVRQRHDERRTFSAELEVRVVSHRLSLQL